MAGKILEEVDYMKGIILAGGSGSRLRPLTEVVCKQLLPVYDKPMIYYPLSTLIHAGVDSVLLICAPEELNRFESLLGTGEKFGITIQYAVQVRPEGLPQGIVIAEEFLNGEGFWFILGDNLFHGPGLACFRLRDQLVNDAFEPVRLLDKHFAELVVKHLAFNGICISYRCGHVDCLNL